MIYILFTMFGSFIGMLLMSLFVAMGNQSEQEQEATEANNSEYEKQILERYERLANAYKKACRELECYSRSCGENKNAKEFIEEFLK